MPSLAKRACAEPGCRELVAAAGRCAVHQRTQSRARGTTKERGYAEGWPKVRAENLAIDRICQIRICCSGAVATEVDHIIPITERPDLRLEWSNLQSACKPCNAAKARGTLAATADTSLFVGGCAYICKK